jgi:hypothetical protein
MLEHNCAKGYLTTKSFLLTSRVTANRTLELYVPADLPESEVEVVIIVRPISSAAERESAEERGWPPRFFERTAGCLGDDPIQRWLQDPREEGRTTSAIQRPYRH